ncbi:glycosyltransferase family 39 protein [Kamptonema cortianum]|nr:glycosyltransferase family 39 protein [Geitlerinema splendidum]MDK3160447.1 glycosyltransferase family 39 protein [Kamptonema cortianum]
MGRSALRRESAWPLLILLALGAIVRVWWLGQVDTQPVTDFDWYFERAAGIVAGQGYSVDAVATAYWPAGYPLFLSVFFWIFGSTVSVAKAVNLLLTLSCVALTYLITHRLTTCRPVALVAAAIVCFSPAMIAYSGILASEPLFCALLLVSVYLSVLSLTRPALWYVTGLASALAAMVRPQAVLVPFVLLLAHWIWRGKTERFQPLIATVAVTLSLIIGLLPWTIRNAVIYKSFVFISTNGGDNLWIGNNPKATGEYIPPPGRPSTPSNELKNDRETRKLAIQHMTKNPREVIGLWPKKFAATFFKSTDAPYWAFQTKRGELVVPGMGPERNLFLKFRSINKIYTVSLFVLACLGLFAGLLSTKGRRIIVVAASQVALVTVITFVFFGNGRFGFSAIPFLAILSSGLLMTMLEWTGAASGEDDLLDDE